MVRGVNGSVEAVVNLTEIKTDEKFGKYKKFLCLCNMKKVKICFNIY